MIQPQVTVLEEPTIKRVLAEAYEVLATVGVKFGSDCSAEPMRLLVEAGADVDMDKRLARIPAALIDAARSSVPNRIAVHDLAGELCMDLSGENVYYYPTSTGMTIWDAAANRLRAPMSADLVKYIKVAEGLPNCDAQSSVLYCCDVPGQVVDAYRNYLLLKYGRKPYVSGAYSAAGQQLEIDLLQAWCGGAEALAARPCAVMTACPSPPLKWSYTADSVVLCARAMVPMGIGPMPLSGGTGPVTLIGTIVQHSAEALSGLVLAQLARPGAPVLWMNPTSIFDMSEGTTPLGAIETQLLCLGTDAVAKFLQIPTLNYMGVSDAKMVDAQQAMETTCGILLAALGRSNLNGSLGMINFESGQSYEGLVVSHEAVGMARRLLEGINTEMDNLGSDLIRQVGHDGSFLETEHTMEWFRKEFYFPGIIDRCTENTWRKRGARGMVQRATERVDELVAAYTRPEHPEAGVRAVEDIMSNACSQYGLRQLPD